LSLNQRTAIIVLNWNAAQDTVSCLESLLPVIENHRATIIVCDNHSNDDSVKRIKRWATPKFPISAAPNNAQFVLLQIKFNSGYASGNNVGIQYAIDHDFSHVWILNNDTVVTENALTALLRCSAQHPEIACYGSTLVDYSETRKVQCAAGCRYQPLTTVRTELYHGRDIDWVRQQENNLALDYVCGAAMFVNVEALRKTGLLNQQFFLYCEELDLAQRLRKAGFQLGWCKNSVVRHRTPSSREIGLQHQQRLHYHENLSTLIYTWSHHRPLFAFAAGFRFIAKLVVLPLSNRIQLVPSLFKAYFDFFTFRWQLDLFHQQPPNVGESLFLKK